MKAMLDWKHRGFIHGADIGSFLGTALEMMAG